MEEVSYTWFNRFIALRFMEVNGLNNKLKLNVFVRIAVIVVPAAPDIIPQISPITSQQKLDTLSAFFLNLTATSAPLTFLEFME